MLGTGSDSACPLGKKECWVGGLIDPIDLADPGPFTAKSPTVLEMPNGDAMNSVARGENNEGVVGTSCEAKSIRDGGLAN